MPDGSGGDFEAGDVVWVEFGARVGHEQAGRRPAVVISPLSYNERSSLILVCPITRNSGAWPFKVDMPPTGRVQGSILVDHVRSIDREARFVRREERVDGPTVAHIYRVIAALLGVRAFSNPA